MKKEFEKYGLPITEKQEKLLEQYYKILVHWNEKMNLTAITEYNDVVRKHFIDSALLVLCDEFSRHSSNSVLDLGCGAGFPGMVLAILRPQDSFTLVDSLRKRIDFLKIVVSELGLTNVNLFHGRAEDFGQNLKFRNSFDFVVSRAVAELPLLLEFCVPFVKVEGYFISYKGPKYEQEIAEAGHALQELSAKVEFTKSFQIDGEKRYFVFIRNCGITNNKYPRRAGIPKKKPL